MFTRKSTVICWECVQWIQYKEIHISKQRFWSKVPSWTLLQIKARVLVRILFMNEILLLHTRYF